MQIGDIFVMATKNWNQFLSFGVTDKPCFGSSHGAALKHDAIANIQFKRLGSYWQWIRQSLQIFMDRPCRLTASLQNRKHKIQSSILITSFLKLQIIRFGQGHGSCTKTHWNSYFIATPMKKYIFSNSFYHFYFFITLCI